ncbi:MAG: hypothetical protein ACKVOO_12215 [Burkholderiaceae bacterium]
MQLVKTDKGREELASKQRNLQLRERAALLMADGTKTRAEMQGLLQDDGAILEKLISEGYLSVGNNAVTAKEAWNNSTGSWSTSTGATQAAQATGTFKAQATGAFQSGATGAFQVPAAVPAGPAASDNFEGKRSLATTRMFLFDICERMFVRKLPHKANLYRDLLREAKDREAMLAVARDMINDVEEIAGHERADGISERIAMLLPPE